MRTEQNPMNETLGHVFKRPHYSIEMILVCVRCARMIIAGIETMHIIRKVQLADIKNQTSFYF